MTFEKNKIQTGSWNVTCTDWDKFNLLVSSQSGHDQQVHLLWTWASSGLFTRLDNLILSRWPPCRTSPQLPGARSRKSLRVSHIWSTKAGQMSVRTSVNATVMCFLTQMTSFRLLFLSPLGERQGRDDGRQRSSALSSPTPSHYFISLSQ